MRLAMRLTNPVAALMAGHRVVTVYAVLRHRGRRTGKEYAVPVAIGATPDSFVLPVAHERAQWIPNVMAAGECVVRWNGREWRAVEPEIIDRSEAVAAFGPVARFLLRFLPIKRFLRLRRA
jgi:hypothetical protein